MFSLSLHHLTALDASPSELVRFASAAGCKNVTLFTYMPVPYRHRYPMIEAGEVDLLADVMGLAEVACHSLEVFPLTVDPDWEELTRGLDIGSRLEAQFATVHSHLEDEREAVEQMVRLGDIAGQRGIGLALEFNPFSKCASLACALRLVEQAERCGTPVGIVLDTLHAVRSGVTVAEIGSAADHIRYVQLSDGPRTMPSEDKWKEAISHRLYPAEGELPLAEMLATLSRRDLPLDVEVPRRADPQGRSTPEERCRVAIEHTRRFMDRVGLSYVR